MKLLLEAGFVTPETNVRADLFATMQDVIDNNGQRISKDVIFTDNEAGVVQTVAQIGDWVQIRYTAGFSASNGNFADVPNWLQRAAVSGAIRYMRGFQSKWNNKDIRDTKEEIHRLMEMHLTAKIRTKYGAFPYHAKELA